MNLEALTLLETSTVRNLVATWPAIKIYNDNMTVCRRWSEISGVHYKLARKWLKPLIENQIVMMNGTIDELAMQYIAEIAMKQCPPRRQYRQKAQPSSTVIAKREYSKIRKDEYKTKAAKLVLAMIEAGHEYICQFAGCKEVENLTIDHIIPMSRGGSDDLDNLRFLCLSHNSSRRDRLDDEP